MSVPLDRLYHFINQFAEEIWHSRTLIYRFHPNGSKKLDDLSPLYPMTDSWGDISLRPTIICNDQEPLNFDYYELESTQQKIENNTLSKWLAKNITPLNFRKSSRFYDKAIVLHSEQRSDNVKKYHDNNFIPTYYWAHALIALDWFRYAQYTNFKKQTKKTFLIYNRAWSGTREYRLKFAEHLIRLGLPDDCRTSINPVEPELDIHYEIHRFDNPAWRPKTVLENFFPISTAHSHYSADFDTEDYEATDIEVVLETLFDDNRLHLTEKSLRPIACGQPFILAGTHGSLEYLRSYGFKTFGMIWDERYDECLDSEERLARIADLMKQIANWGPWLREQKMAEARAISDYNRKYFFSENFSNQIVNELKENLTSAFNELKNTQDYRPFIKLWSDALQDADVNAFLNKNKNHYYPTKHELDQLLQLAKDHS
jgi:hypothetical protein